MITQIRKKLKSKDHKRLVENFLSLSALQVFGIILPLVTLPYVLRVVGLHHYGVVVMASSIISYFTSVTDYSFRITATRDVAVFRGSNEKLNLIYSKVMIVKILLLMFSSIVIGLVVFLYKPFYEERLIFFLTLPMLIGHTIFPEWYFQGIEKMKYITILNLGVKLIFTIGVFVLIKQEEDYWIYPLMQSLGYVGAGVIGQMILVQKYKVRLILLGRSRIKETLKANYPIFINQFVPNLYNNTSTVLLGLLTNSTVLGTYDAIKRVTDVFNSIQNIVSRVFFPFINRKKNAFIAYKQIMLLFGFMAVLLPIVFSQIIFWYLNITHSEAFISLIILSIGVLGFTLYDVFGVNYFVVKRQDKLVMRHTFVISLIGFVMAFPLINFMGILGAAINLALTRILLGVSLYIKYRKDVAKDFLEN